MAVRNDFTAGEVLAAADLNDTFAAKSNLASPTFTGTPAAPTAAAGTNTTQLATTAFVQSAGGLTLITSEAFSAVSSVSVNGCFTSTYTNYLLIVEGGTSANVYLQIRLRAAGTDAITNYVIQELSAQNTSLTGARATAQTQGRLGFSSGAVFYSVTQIHQPQLAFPTYWQSNFSRDASTTCIDLQYNYHSTAAAYDGFTLFPASGNITGNVRVYGYKNS